jgi:hypothetical protein
LRSWRSEQRTQWRSLVSLGCTFSSSHIGD